MTLTRLLDSIKNDADLLTRGDAWLEHEREVVSSELQCRADYLKKVIAAQTIKKILQNKNLVAVQHICRNTNNEATDVVIKVMKLPDAIRSIEESNDILDEINSLGQITTWRADGYDIATSRSLRN
jgi:hypothetical protein